mmetsp:Transcript_42551/g.71010  ORF Transcript_42551/g.71010 Transcript_42551/m.71010 type:complete len:253 (-) Transcript_42551:5789-6547(-)
MSLFFFGSPTTSHQLSSFLLGKRGASTAVRSPSMSRSRVTITVTVSPVTISSASCTSYFRSMSGYRLHHAATVASFWSLRARASRRSSSSISMRSITPSTPAAAHRSAVSRPTPGICISAGSLSHSACVTICDISIHASAGDSQPDDEITSTIACKRRWASTSTRRWSSTRSPLRLARLKCACSMALAFVCGSVNLGLSSVTGECCRILRTMSSSPGRMGMESNSAAEHKISSRPLVLVLAVSEEENSSSVV